MKPELCVARAGFRVLGRRSVKGATVLTAKTFASRKMPDSKTALCYSFLVRLPPLARRFGILLSVFLAPRPSLHIST